MASKLSVKQLLLDLGHAANPDEAEKLVLSRRVLAGGEVVKFAGFLIDPELGVSIVPERKFFSRAGEKLDSALTQFQIDINGRVCADVGASTGGFTGVLLERGAQKVYAIDVARGEIAWKLRTDPRVILMEKTNARELSKLPEEIDFVSIDVSFISVSKILPNVKNWLKESGTCVVLVKPQFEAPRDLVEKGGVIRNKSTHRLVLENFLRHAKDCGFEINSICASPIEGMEGNKEFLAMLSFVPPSLSPDFLQLLLEC